MNDLASGSCLCGAVQFQARGAFESFFLCHCSRCRKDTGSAHAANLFSTNLTIDWTTGTDSISTFQLPETRHMKSFCKHCGSAVPSSQMDGALWVVPAGCLDSPVTLRPRARICYDDRAEWCDGLDRVEKIGGLPG